jgi:hypothetical protein
VFFSIGSRGSHGLGGNYCFPGNPRESDLPFVEQEGCPLTIAGLSFGDVGDDIGPPGSQHPLQVFQGAQIFPNLLERKQVEAGGDFGDIGERFLGTSASLGGVEFADVPGR